MKQAKKENSKDWNKPSDMWVLSIILAVSLSAWIAASSVDQVLSYLAPIATVLSVFGMVLKSMLAPIERQVYNHLPTENKEMKGKVDALSHLPTQINELKDSQKEIKNDQREMKNKVDALSHLPEQVKELKENQREMRKDIEDLTAQGNQNFKELVSLITKHRTG